MTSQLFRAFWINIFHFYYHCTTASSGAGSPLYGGFMITLRHTTLSRTPLDEWLAHHRDIYLTTHNSHNRHPWPLRIRTRNSRKQAATDSLHKSRSHLDRQCVHLMHQIHALTVYNITVTSIRHVLAGQFHHQEVHSNLKTIHTEMNNICVLSVHSAANSSV